MRPRGPRLSSRRSHKTCCSGSASFELVLIRLDVFTMRQLAGEFKLAQTFWEEPKVHVHKKISYLPSPQL